MNEFDFCEPCADGKHYRSRLPTTDGRAKESLELVHSDGCESWRPIHSVDVNTLTFINDKSRYVWVYMLKRKNEVFEKFLECKIMVEKASRKVIKFLRSDNGEENISKDFEDYLKVKRIRHEYTFRKTPEQNGFAARLNRTLLEMVRSLL